jgi:hypothetical protein
MALDPNDPYALATWDEDLEARFLAGVGTPYGVDPMVQPAPMQITAPVGAPPQEAPAAAIAQPLTPQEEQQIEIDQPAPPVQEPTLADAYSNVIPFAIGSATHPDDEQAPAPTMESEIGLADQFTNLIPSAIGSARNPMTDDELSQDALNDKYTETALTDPAKYAEITAKQDLAREEHLANRMLEEADADRKRLADNFKIEQEARAKHKQDSAKLDAEAQALAEEDIDGDRWMDSRSTLQTIAAFTAAIVGGLNQHNTGGRNMGLEAIEREIDRDVEIQKANLAKRERLLGMRRDAAQSTFQTEMEASRSAEVHRQALYQQAIRGLQVEMQKYDPRGTTWRRIADNAADMQARQQAARAKWEQQNFENELKLQEFGLKNRDQLLKEKKAAGIGGAAKPKVVDFDDVKRTADQLKSLNINLPDGFVMPPEGLSLNDVKKLAQSGKSGEEWNKAIRDNSPEERNRQLSVGELVDVDDKPLQFRSAESAEKVATQKAAGDFMVQLLDRMDTAYQKHGWSSDLLRDPEWQEAQADLSQYILEKKNLDQLGVLAGPDLDLIKGSYGKNDPTGMRDPGPGLRRARENTIEKVNSTVRAQVAGGQKPKRWSPPKPPPAPPKTPSDEAYQEALGHDPMKSVPLADVTRELGIDTSKIRGSELKTEIDRALAQHGGVLPSIKRQVDNFAAIARDEKKPQEERADAAAKLQRLADESEDKAVREYALRAGLKFEAPASPEEVR